MAGVSLLDSLSKALYNETYVSHDTAVGFQALFNNSGHDIGIDGTHNSGLGYRAGYSFEDQGRTTQPSVLARLAAKRQVTAAKTRPLVLTC